MATKDAKSITASQYFAALGGVSVKPARVPGTYKEATASYVGSSVPYPGISPGWPSPAPMTTPPMTPLPNNGGIEEKLERIAKALEAIVERFC